MRSKQKQSTKIRVQKSDTWKQYAWTSVPNTIIRHPELPWAAKGIAAWIASHTETFDFDARDIADAGLEGRDKAYGLLRALEQAGFLTRHRNRDERTGQLVPGIVYQLHPMPVPDQCRTYMASRKKKKQHPGTQNPSSDLKPDPAPTPSSSHAASDASSSASDTPPEGQNPRSGLKPDPQKTSDILNSSDSAPSDTSDAQNRRSDLKPDPQQSDVTPRSVGEQDASATNPPQEQAGTRDDLHKHTPAPPSSSDVHNQALSTDDTQNPSSELVPGHLGTGGPGTGRSGTIYKEEKTTGEDQGDTSIHPSTETKRARATAEQSGGMDISHEEKNVTEHSGEAWDFVTGTIEWGEYYRRPTRHTAHEMSCAVDAALALGWTLPRLRQYAHHSLKAVKDPKKAPDYLLRAFTKYLPIAPHSGDKAPQEPSGGSSDAQGTPTTPPAQPERTPQQGATAKQAREMTLEILGRKQEGLDNTDGPALLARSLQLSRTHTCEEIVNVLVDEFAHLKAPHAPQSVSHAPATPDAHTTPEPHNASQGSHEVSSTSDDPEEIQAAIQRSLTITDDDPSDTPPAVFEGVLTSV